MLLAKKIHQLQVRIVNRKVAFGISLIYTDLGSDETREVSAVRYVF